MSARSASSVARSKSSSGSASRKSSSLRRKVSHINKVFAPRSTLYDADCVRKRANFSGSKKVLVNLIDDPKFHAQMKRMEEPERTEAIEQAMEEAKVQAEKSSLKGFELLKKIAELDEQDLREHGKLFKHFIFSDVKSSAYGAKMIASLLVASGKTLGYRAQVHSGKAGTKKKEKKTRGGSKKEKKFEKISLLSQEELAQNYQENFYLLSSTTVFDQPISVPLKKEMLANFNRRPDNVYGENIRFIVMDSGFKEGIDLFDVKYVHIFEPQLTLADQKQVIGRGTRTCGQKGLEFHPTKGWPLHVFIYDIEFPKDVGRHYGAETVFGLYLKALNIDLRLYTFAEELETYSVLGSVDYELNKNIHSFSISDSIRVDSRRSRSESAAHISKLFKGNKEEIPSMPRKLNHSDTRAYIDEFYSEFKWDDVKMENLCEEKQRGGKGGKLITYTPTQAFVQHYFTPEHPLKGMLLWHSVGTGKTCSAIAAATSSFESKGYTILWVTRTTLKNDIWKNMFDQVCHEVIRHKIEKEGLDMPDSQEARMKLLSKSWRIKPISYKQFSNLVSKSNKLYHTLVKINGEEDPLRKTLLIIDEAHKLYGGNDLSTIEKPDMDALHRALMNSYLVSGRDSVKLMLMTATPITQDPMELIKLINLCKDTHHQMPANFDLFADRFLNAEGKFTERGKEDYMNAIAGYISYLNREKDARQFSQPIIQRVNIPFDRTLIENFDVKMLKALVEQDEDVLRMKTRLAEMTVRLQDEIGQVDKNRFKGLLDVCKEYQGEDKQSSKVFKKCEKFAKKSMNELAKELREEVKSLKKEVKAVKELLAERKKDLNSNVTVLKDKLKDEEADLEEYKKSLVYNLNKKCLKKATPKANVAEFFEHDEELNNINSGLDMIDAKIEKQMEIINDRKTLFASKLKSYKEDLKATKDKKTKEHIMKRIEGLRKAYKSDKEMNKGNLRKVKKFNEEKKPLLKDKKVRLRSLKKSLKAEKKALNKQLKSNNKEKTKLQKSLRKMKEFREEFKEGYLKNKFEDRKADVREQTLEFMGEVDAKQKAKIAAKEEKKAAKVAAKEEKKAAKLEEKTRKQQAKVAAKEEKKTAKMEEKTRKQQAKVAAKEEKVAAKEAAKQEKVLEKSRKQQAKIAAKEEKAAAKQQTKKVKLKIVKAASASGSK